MSTLSIIAAVLFAGLAVSYGWGMRGCIIGGEKGALVPGALLGLSVSLLCGNGTLKEFFPFFCAAGALGMTFGGIDTYAQTMGFILHREKEPYKNKIAKGCAGIFLKGAVWFGIASTVLAMLPGALSGKVYTLKETAILFTSVPFVALIGTQVFNKPFDRENNKFPKLYFSVNRFEEWGANVFVLAELIMFAAIKKDMFALGGAIAGIVSGGCGFLLGLLSYNAVEREHNGKYIFGNLQRKGLIDGWKIMEHFFGAMGGGGVMLYFCLNADKLQSTFSDIDTSALFFGGERETLALCAVLGMVLITALQYPIKLYIAKKGKKPEDRPFELVERPLWASFALIFIFGGSEKAAFASAFMTIAYALAEKCIAEWYSDKLRKKMFRAAVGVFFGICTVYFFINGCKIPAVAPVILYTFGYTVPAMFFVYGRGKDKPKRPANKSILEYYRSGFTVTAHFLLQSAVITAITYVLR